jgi:hypothetical protein
MVRVFCEDGLSRAFHVRSAIPLLVTWRGGLSETLRPFLPHPQPSTTLFARLLDCLSLWMVLYVPLLGVDCGGFHAIHSAVTDRGVASTVSAICNRTAMGPGSVE